MRVTRLAVVLLAATAVVSCSTTPPPAMQAREKYKPVIGKEEDPDARERWYWEQRTFPTGSIPIDVHRSALQRELGTRRLMADGEQWTNLGPSPLLDITYAFDSVQNSSGRALTIAIHPQNPSTLLLGAAQGGVWKSTDRGVTWRATAEQSLPTLAINIIKYSPANADVVFAGTGEPNGSTSIHGSGLLKSTDGGETWSLLPTGGDGWNFAYQAITGLHFDARDANTLYVTTATITAPTAFFKTPPDAPLPGLFKSTNGGQSWTRLRTATKHEVTNSFSSGFMDFEYGGATAPDLMMISEYFGGILKSTDAGATWRYVTPRKTNGYGAFPTPIPQVSYFDSAQVRFRRMTRFENPAQNIDFRRPEIAIAPSNPQIVYAGYDAPSLRIDYNENNLQDGGDRSFTTSLLFKSVDGGETWRWLGSMLDGIPDYCGAQCTYDNVITVNPSDPEDVWIGGFAYYTGVIPQPLDAPTRLLDTPWRGMIYRSRDGGKSWVDTTPHCTRFSSTPTGTLRGLPVYGCLEKDPTRVIHPDTHAIVLANDGSLYVANDGGLYRTSTIATPPPFFRKHRAVGARTPPELAGTAYKWENLNTNLSTLQFYRIGAHPTNPNAILGGMQDNSAGFFDGERWHGWGAGDGTIAIFDPRDPQYIYLGTQFAVHRHDGGGAKDFTQTAGWKWDVFAGQDFVSNTEKTSFIPVFVLDPVEPTITYGGSNEGIYRSTTRGTQSKRLGLNQPTDGVPTTISVSPVNHNVVWAGTNNGTIYRYDVQPLGNSTMVRVDTGLPNRHVSRVMASPVNADTVYAVFNGYDANTPSTPGKVFVSTDRGATWTNISGNLPDVPATAIAIDRTNPNRIFIATDAAVYSTSNGGATWQSERRNMPVVAVQDLDLNPVTGYLVAATHGRGVWRMRVD